MLRGSVRRHAAWRGTLPPSAPGYPAGADILKIDGHQRRLPVVAVEDVGHPVQTGQQVDDRLAEKGEALAVVVLAVQRAAAEIVLVVHEVPCHAVLLQREQAAALL